MSDLSPLIDSPVESLWVAGLELADYSPLAHMPLRHLVVTVSHLDPAAQAIVRSFDQLETLGEAGDDEDQTPEVFWQRFDDGEYAIP